MWMNQSCHVPCLWCPRFKGACAAKGVSIQVLHWTSWVERSCGALSHPRVVTKRRWSVWELIIPAFPGLNNRAYVGKNLVSRCVPLEAVYYFSSLFCTMHKLYFLPVITYPLLLSQHRALLLVDPRGHLVRGLHGAGPGLPIWSPV